MTKRKIILSGIGASPGIALGTALVMATAPRNWRREHIADADIERTLEIVRVAFEETRQELTVLAAQAMRVAGEAEAAILETQAMFLDDPALREAVEEGIRVHRRSAPWAVHEAFAAFAALLQGLDNEYMRQRAVDVREVGQRVLLHLIGEDPDSRLELPDRAIIVAEDLGPAQIISLDRDRLAGLVTAQGGTTSHTAILARSLGIPAVVGVANLLGAVRSDDLLALDGEAGQVVVNPSGCERERYRDLQAAEEAERQRLRRLVQLDTVTLDGRKIGLWANIGRPEEASVARAMGAEGIGLLRTEFLYMNRSDAPGEEEQEAAYRLVLMAMEGRPVVIRTLDIGGDKQLPYLALPKEENPVLGIRGIRLALQETGLFKTQLRAILRASTAGDLWLMFPMIATLEELQAAKGLLREAREELRAQGIPVADHIKVGIMIETPAAAMTADLLAPEVDFFSIGTNDLIQYTMAADRQNDRLTRLCQPTHPAVVRLIARSVKAGHAAGIPVGMCGEMAGDPNLTELLVGLGLDELSMSATSLLRVKERLLGLSAADAARTAAQFLRSTELTEVDC